MAVVSLQLHASLPSSLNSAPCPCASLLSQRARCGWIRDRALPTHPAGEALPRVPRPQERGKWRMWGGRKILKMEVNTRRWRKILKTTTKKKGFWCEGEDALYRKEKRVTLTVISPPDCVFFLVLKIQSHIEVQALCLWSAPTQYHFRPVGVIVVQLTEQREADSESWSCGTDSCGSFALESQLCYHRLLLMYGTKWKKTNKKPNFASTGTFPPTCSLISFILLNFFHNGGIHLIAGDLCRRPRVI